jgi:pyruvate formate lyase activating enzyme
MNDSVSIKGNIFKIKRFAVHDGPGIRTAVFLKGCPLNCIWCHSPEGIDPGISLWYNPNTCILCSRCVESCPEHAIEISRNEQRAISIDRNICKLSGECVSVCPTGSIEFTGESKSVSDILETVLKDKLFYENSGGGITITGGEPLFQPEFSLSILRNCKKNNIHTAIETSLFCEKKVLDVFTEYVDLFIVDMKFFDSEQHKKFTGKTNETIRKNLSYLAESGKGILVRIPLIPGITDTEKNLTEIAEYVNSFSRVIPIEYLDYNTLAENNYKRLNIPFLLTDIL